MLRSWFTAASLGGLAALALAPVAAHAEAWSRTYAVEWMEPALYFGSAGTNAADAKGTDCPKGINPENDWEALLRQGGYTPAEAHDIMTPDAKMNAQKRTYVKMRGPNKSDIFANPTAFPDPGFLEVEGKIGYGFDLDGNAGNGYTSPDGKTKGIDNNFYKVVGCTMMWRGQPREGFEEKYSNDNMRDGKHTTMIVISGNGSPMNDPDAKVGIYTSPDHLSKDGNGNIAHDYTFRLDTDAKYESVVPVSIKNGVVETKAPTDMTMHEYVNIATPLVLYKGQLRLEMKPDGTLAGLVGGYEPWKPFHANYNGFIKEEVGHYQTTALWFSLKRNADAMPDPKTGENTAISAAYRFDAVPAFAVSPKGDRQVTVAELFLPDPGKAEPKLASNAK